MHRLGILTAGWFWFLSLFSVAQLPQKISILPAEALPHGLRILQYNSAQELKFKLALTESFVQVSNLEPEKTILVRALGFEDLMIPWTNLEMGDSIFVLKRLGIHLKDHAVIGLRLPEFSADREVLRLDRAAIEDAQAPTTAELLERAGVFVQRSQLGGGSPVLRGFEASRILLVVDGIRLNHAAFRSGHLQQIIRNDALAMESIDLVYGSGTVAFGSDALGGLIQMNTLPLVFNKEGQISGHVHSRFSSAAVERTLHADASYSKGNWAGLSSFTISDFGDLRQGALTDPRDPGRWDARFTVRRIQGKDTLFQLKDPNIQTNSRYGQLNAMQKLGWQGKKMRHYLNLQYATTRLVPRYDRLTDSSASGLPLFARWDYGPEEQLLLSFHSETVQSDRLHWSQALSYQQFKESRIVRRFQNPWEQSQNEHIQVLGYSWQGSLTERGRRGSAYPQRKTATGMSAWLRFGFDAQFHWVNSKAWALHVDDSLQKAAETRYPSAGSHMIQSGIWAEALLFSKGASTLQLGGRIQINGLQANFSDTLFFSFPFQEINYLLPSANGSLTYIFEKKGHTFRSSASSSFRAPNVDDIAKVFDSQPGSVILPNPNLRPEYLLGIEAEYRIQMRGQHAAMLGYVSHAPGLLSVQSGQFMGQDSIPYQGFMSAVNTLQNATSAWIFGAQLRYRGQLSPRLHAFGQLTYTYGRQVVNQGWQPVDHIPPLHGQLGLEWRKKSIELGLRADFSDWKRLEEYGLQGEDNLRYATPWGMPGWWTLNSHLNWKLRQGIQLRLQLNNILDLRYRAFSSGISAAGRNFMISLNGSF